MFLIKRFDWTVFNGYHLIGQYIFRVLSRDLYREGASCRDTFVCCAKLMKTRSRCAGCELSYRKTPQIRAYFSRNQTDHVLKHFI